MLARQAGSLSSFEAELGMYEVCNTGKETSGYFGPASLTQVPGASMLNSASTSASGVHTAATHWGSSAQA